MISDETRLEMDQLRSEARRLALKNDVLQDDGVAHVLYHLVDTLARVLNRLDEESPMEKVANETVN